MKKILLISGLDPSGNAGLLADLEIVWAHGLHAAAATTALTAQNRNKFYKSQSVSAKVFKKTLEALSPLSQYDAIKIGMLGNEKLIHILLPYLKKFKGPVVLDPVTHSSTGGELLSVKGQKLLIQKILPLATVWTPNIPEAAAFLGMKNPPLSPVLVARLTFEKFKTPVYLKGGHHNGPIRDIYCDGATCHILAQKRLPKPMRGTGCRLATSLAITLTKGQLTSSSLLKMRKRFQKSLEAI